ncbi:metallophosphoesterase family protein [Paenibacillus roseipurpureus]|uniref:Phosphoesterase n=1 Tax=Paenibacillus roseopurpureus TaxID=2918901 RepID=A0AA96LQM4_9BACL|nr:metallophosphoesterase [Paenibacillus sp. MBLB1832]WNR45389.1 metallophosphoesterase [Paenibacillus sp. MBLB1832]
MRIVVVSDTHMPRMAKKLPIRLLQELELADLILHAGDWTSLDVYDELTRFAPVEGIAGNNDGEQIIRMFGFEKTIQIGQVKIGLLHGHTPHKKLTAEQKAMMAYQPGETDAVVFGHSHIPLMKLHNGILLFNPGSPTDKRRMKQHSFGIMEIEGTDIKAEHVFYDSKE